jgi:hypothetical protein
MYSVLNLYLLDLEYMYRYLFVPTALVAPTLAGVGRVCHSYFQIYLKVNIWAYPVKWQDLGADNVRFC